MNIEQALERHQDRLMAIPGVIGVGIGEAGGRPALVVMVKQMTPELKAHLPQKLEDHPVVFEQSGEIFAFSA